MSETKREKRNWKVRDISGKIKVAFTPVFEIKSPESGDIDVEQKEVECRYVEIEIKDDKGKETTLSMNYLDMFMFIYMCANEELRQQLQMRYERKAGAIPYEVTFSLSQEEKTTGVAKRLITLNVDDITMAIARAEARLMSGKATPEFLETYMARKTGKIKDPGHYTHKRQT